MASLQELVAAAEKEPENRDRQLAAAWACFRNAKAIDALYFLNRLSASGPKDGQVELLRESLECARDCRARQPAFLWLARCIRR